MINLELSIEREIDFMIRYGLTPDELFLIKLIWYAQDGHNEYLSEYFSENQLTLELRDVLISLQKKGMKENFRFLIKIKNIGLLRKQML